jgi:hypothetical protein
MSRMTRLERRLSDLVARGVYTSTRKADTFGTEVELTLSRTSEAGFEYEVEVTVCGTALAFVRGRYQGDPSSCYPDEGGYAEDITAFFCRNGAWTELTLTSDEEGRANDAIMELEGSDDSSYDRGDDDRDFDRDRDDRACNDAFDD